jgi:hypothetical protein
MLHAIVSFHLEGAPADAFLNKPKVLYRVGSKLARIEEAEDPEQKLHLVLVVNQPDMWMVNLVDGSGRHAADPDGPSGNFHAPVLGDADSVYWRDFETGCEEAFMKAAGVKGEVDQEGNIRYALDKEERHVVLTVTRDHKPLRVDAAEPKARYRITYDAYEWTAPRPELFEKPKGIRFTEATPEP